MDQYSGALLNILRGQKRPTLTLYPVTSGVPATGALVACQAGAWSAAYVDIVGAGAITEPFWLVQMQLDGLAGGAVQVFEVQIYNLTTTTTLFSYRFNPTAVTLNIGPVTFPYPIYCNASARIQARTGGAAARSVNVSLLVATRI